MKRTAALAAVVMAVGLMMLVGGNNNNDNDDGGGIGSFDDRLLAGAPCAELVDIRNELAPYPDLVLRIDEQLLEVGCDANNLESPGDS